MGRQVAFFLTEDDLRECIDFLKSRYPDFTVIPSRITVDGKPSPDNPHPSEVYFSAERFLGQIVWESLWSGELYPIISSSPIIEAGKSIVLNGRLIVGRFYYIPSYYTHEGEVRKPPDFIKLADSAIRWVRRKCPKKLPGGWGYVGKDAYARLLKGEFVLYDPSAKKEYRATDLL